MKKERNPCELLSYHIDIIEIIILDKRMENKLVPGASRNSRKNPTSNFPY